MQTFSQIGEVPWPTLTQILQNMPLKLFLVNTNNINNHSINLDNPKSDFEPGLVPNEIGVMYVDWVSGVTRFYNVLWPSSVYFSICH